MTGDAPGFIIQIELVPERLDRKASVPSGAKLGDQVRPLAASTISGAAAQAQNPARARFERLISVSSAKRPLAMEKSPTRMAVV